MKTRVVPSSELSSKSLRAEDYIKSRKPRRHLTAESQKEFRRVVRQFLEDPESDLEVKTELLSRWVIGLVEWAPCYPDWFEEK